MKFVALVSGGKDSIYSIIQCQRQGHELVACVHLGKKLKKKLSSSSSREQDNTDNENDDDDEEEEESYMYQTAASEAVSVLLEQCIGVPLILYERQGKSINTRLVYDQQQQQQQDGEDDATAATGDNNIDEVEDLYEALRLAKQRFPDIEAVSSGAILSTYQRVRIENVCCRLNLVSLSYLWRHQPQIELLNTMIHGDTNDDDDNDNNNNDDNDNSGITAVLVRVAAPPGLVPRKHLNRSIRDLQSHFMTLHSKYQFHVCGEGGEYETLVLDCPLYKTKRLVLDEVEIVEDADDDGVGNLLIRKCHAEVKTSIIDEKKNHSSDPDNNGSSSNGDDNDGGAESSSPLQPQQQQQQQQQLQQQKQQPLPSNIPSFTFLPRIRKVSGGFFHLSEITSPYVVPSASTSSSSSSSSCDEAELAAQEALQIFAILEKILRRYNCTSRDVLMVHLYLSEMSHFAAINHQYRGFFGVVLPPSRSCVGVGIGVLPGGRRIALDCIVQCGSGSYMRNMASPTNNNINNPYLEVALANTTTKLRDVLHVQSISHWAPVCVGPYSQVNTYRNTLHFVAGQIGLVPSTMKLRDALSEQLQQAWKNAARVLDALNGCSLDHMLSGLVYVASSVFHQRGSVPMIESVCSSLRESNAGVIAGLIDGTAASSSYMGYEDEGTMKELMKEQPNEDNNKVICPLLLVAIPEMPVGALTEVEIIASTADAASCLPIKELISNRKTRVFGGDDCDVMTPDEQLGWTTGHDFRRRRSERELSDNNEVVSLESRVISMANHAVVCAVATASVAMDNNGDDTACQSAMVDLDCEALLRSMLKLLVNETIGNDCNDNGESTSWLHFRLYYVASRADGKADDGTIIMEAFHSAISMCSVGLEPPAATVVPVDGIRLLGRSKASSSNSTTTTTTTVFAIQALAIDPVRAETELWIHRGRGE